MVVHTKLDNKSVPTSQGKFKRSAIAAAVATLSTLSYAQEQTSGVVEELIVTGTRATIQNSIDLKRDSVTVVDGLSEDEIGAIPALSIGEALETITGTVGHRENGGASEISVRGLGPFLGTTVVNGREATNGGGNRAVNFSIFPAEMFNKIAVHKTQSAEYIEGAVSGQIHLDTKKPLEYGKQNFQIAAKGAFSPDEQNIEGGQEFGGRITASYIDQFDIGDNGSIGISIGGQVRDESNPEQEYTTGTGGGRLEACRLESFAPGALPFASDSITECWDEGLDGDGDHVTNVGGRRFLDSNGDPIVGFQPSGVNNSQIAEIIANNDDINSVDDIPFAYVARDHRFRQNTTTDERAALFGVVQWQPNDVLDITFDYQYSERDQNELRNDLDFGTTQEDISALDANPYTGVVSSVTVDTDIQVNTTDFQRLEEYEGFGLNFELQATDDLTLKFDIANSETIRTETDIEINLGYNEDGLDLETTDTGASEWDDDEYFVRIDRDVAGTNGVSLFTFEEGGSNIDINDHRLFTAQDVAQVRTRRQIRENTIQAVRGDFELATNTDFITTVKGGARLSRLKYLTRGDDNRDQNGINEFDDQDFDGVAGGNATNETDGIIQEAVDNCQANFPESGFLSAQVGDKNLVTYEDGTGTSEWATFDFECLGNTLLQNYGGLDGVDFLTDIFSETRDVTEDTFAVYLQADFETELGGLLARGNFGVRVVDTEIHSIGYRAPITITEQDSNDDANGLERAFFIQSGNGLIETGIKSGYTKILPSATLVLDLTDNIVFRTGYFKGMSRPDPNAYANGLALDVDDEEEFATRDQAEAGLFSFVTALGNPFLKPIMSDNLDFGLEWYANDDTIISGAIYYKEFAASFETVAAEQTIDVDGELLSGLVPATQTSDDTSSIIGFELTATHSFDYLPSFLSGFGGTFSYNYADSDFEFEDQFGGDGTSLETNADGSVSETDLIGILPPANIFGLSEHVTATQLYWQNDSGVNISAIYKTRSEYFQEFTRDTQGRIRYTDANETLDLRARYKINRNFEVSLEGRNVTDEPRRDFRGVTGNVSQVLSYGPRYNVGVKVKF